MTPLPWADFLPALEEWLRRTRDLVQGTSDTRDAVAEPPELGVVPDGPLPAALAARAHAAHAEVLRLQAVGSARRAALLRAHAYATS